MPSLEPAVELQGDETLFRARLWYVAAPHVIASTIVSLGALGYWLLFAKLALIVLAMAAIDLVVAVLSYRKTYVAVSPRGIRVRSPFSLDHHTKDFLWPEITDVVRAANGQLEIRCGERFAWIHFGQLADQEGFTSAVARHAGSDSLLAKSLASSASLRGAIIPKKVA